MLHRLFRVASLLLFTLALVAVLGGGSCKFCSGSNCDDDDDCFDDDDTNDDDCGNNQSSDPAPPTTPGLQPIGSGSLPAPAAVPAPFDEPLLAASAYRLTAYDLVTTDDPSAHPVHELRDVTGIDLFALWPLPAYDERAFHAFTRRLLESNPSLLGLPPGAGVLRYAETWFSDSLIVVTWIQTADHDLDVPWPRDDGRVRFAFDVFGRLLLVENRTAIPAGVPRPVLEP